MVTLRYIFFKKIRISDFFPLISLLDFRIMNWFLLIHQRRTINCFYPQFRMKYIWCILTYYICFSYWCSNYPIFALWEQLLIGTWVLLIEPFDSFLCRIRQDVPGLSCSFPATGSASTFSPWCSYSFWFNHCSKVFRPFEDNRLLLPTNVSIVAYREYEK